MPTRFTTRPTLRYGVKGVPSGYEGTVPDQFTIPSCGLTDIDRALFNLFDKELQLSVVDAGGLKRASVIMAAGEKWAQIKKNGGVRDGNGVLILPIVTIVRSDIAQSLDRDVAGRGSNQATGTLLLQRRLSSYDRGLQALLNRLKIEGQTSTAVPTAAALSGQITTARDIGTLLNDPTVADGALLAPNVKQNIVETITIPAPQYIRVSYEVTLWSSHMTQMNSLIENIVSSYMPQFRGWKLTTDKGYWFIANVTSDEFKNEGNAHDMTGQERVIKHSFSIDVPAFILASDAPGNPVPVRVSVSNPSVSFDLSAGDPEAEFGPDVVEEPFLGADDPTLPGTVTKRPDGRLTRHGRVHPNGSAIEELDPATEGLRRGQKPSKWRKVTVTDTRGNISQRLVRIKSQNTRTGEYVLDFAQLEGLTVVSIDD